MHRPSTSHVLNEVSDSLQAARSQSELVRSEVSVLRQELAGLGLRVSNTEPALLQRPRPRPDSPSRPQTAAVTKEVAFRGPSPVATAC